jgi:hypothetical protein
MERWAVIAGYPDYEVSDQGRVRSPKGVLSLNWHRRDGYWLVTLYGPGGRFEPCLGYP